MHALPDVAREVLRRVNESPNEAVRLKLLIGRVVCNGLLAEVLVKCAPVPPPPASVLLHGHPPFEAGSAKTSDEPPMNVGHDVLDYVRTCPPWATETCLSSLRTVSRGGRLQPHES